jgi:hypothetical protein
MLIKTLKWPVICLLVTGTIHLLLEAIRPDLQTRFVPPVLAPVLLAYGLWVGYNAIRGGGNFGHAVLAAALLGLFPIVLFIVGFGLILGRGVELGLTSGLFGFTMILWGAIISSGFSLSVKPESGPTRA